MHATKHSESRATETMIADVEVYFDSNNDLQVVVVDELFRGPEAGDLDLPTGDWEVVFTIKGEEGAYFAPGPILIGLESPGAVDPGPVTFSFSATSETQVVMSFTLTAASDVVYRYALRVVDAASGMQVHDPKVINRGMPG